MIRGRPIRFLASVLGTWTAVRIAMLLSAPAPTAAPQPGPAVAGSRLAGTLGWMVPQPRSRTSAQRAHKAATIPASKPHARIHRALVSRPIEAVPPASAVMRADIPDRGLDPQRAFVRAPSGQAVLAEFAPGAGLSPAEAALPSTRATRRWSGAAWMIWRRADQGAPDVSVQGPRLGAAQAGMRIDYALLPASSLRPSLYARISTALDRPAAAEAAGGIAIRAPGPLPVTIAVERRASLSDGGRDAFALLAAGGIAPADIGGGFQVDGYAQAGLVGFTRPDPFADGRLTVERPLPGARPVALGAAIWGSTQPGATRLDMGPQASLRLRIGRSSFRLAAEWRQQVAGNARPPSGPAFSLGTDF